MKKSYSHFSVADIEALAIKTRCERLFKQITPVEPSELLTQLLLAYQGVPLQSEKAKSEVLISPVLNEIRLRNKDKITYFSGYAFNVDEKRGLKGFCDFLICQSANAVFIESPVLAVVEAKHNQDLLDAIPQCIAEMVAAQLFNERHNQKNIVIFGAITNGYEWLFLKLTEQNVLVDIDRYMLKDLAELLGAWQMIVDSI